MNVQLICGLATVAFLSTGEAQAQIRGPSEPVPQANAADAAGVNAAWASAPLPRRMAAGMEVRDPSGGRIGVIARLGRSQAGQASVMVDVDDQIVRVPVTDFRVSDSGDYVVSNLTKDQMHAGGSASPATP